MKNTVYKSQPPAPFVMELPPYRIPRPRDVWQQMWERTHGFLVKSGTVILGVSVALWLLMAIPAHQDTGPFNQVEAGDSLFGRISGLLAPVFKPAGFGSWQTTGSLVTGILAKEVIVSTMSQIYAGENHSVEEYNSSFQEDLVSVGMGFGRAAYLTVQETINIIPRTINLIPFVDLGEWIYSRQIEKSRIILVWKAHLSQPLKKPLVLPGLGQLPRLRLMSLFCFISLVCPQCLPCARNLEGAGCGLRSHIPLLSPGQPLLLVFQVGKLILI